MKFTRLRSSGTAYWESSDKIHKGPPQDDTTVTMAEERGDLW